MAPTVPFALVGVVQLAAVAAWLGLAGTSTLPRRRSRGAAAMIIGAVALAVADADVSLQFGSGTSQWLGWLRFFGLAMLLIAVSFGAADTGRSSLERGPGDASPVMAGIVVPLGAAAGPSILAGAAGVLAALVALVRSRRKIPGSDRRVASDGVVAIWISVGLAFSGVAAALGGSARTSQHAALAELAARAAGAAGLLIAELLIARTALVGKLVGSIVAGVVVMAIGAVAIVGAGVASDVQGEQSDRLMSVAQSQATELSQLGTRASVDAQVVNICPGTYKGCRSLLDLFAFSPNFFAAIFEPGTGARVIAPKNSPLTGSQLLALDGSNVVSAALKSGAPASGTSGPVLLPGNPDVLAVVAAAPGRPKGETAVSVKPTFAAIYGIGLASAYLQTLRTQIGYDVSIVADGQIIASSLTGQARSQVNAVATSSAIGSLATSRSLVVPAEGDDPTVAFVPITSAANGDVRLATLAISQPASEALAAQRSVLRRLVITALAVLLLVALAAVALAQRIAEPVRRLTVAAGRVRRGDLDTTIAVKSRDEVGSLARAFDAMTASLRGLTSDLREAADNEAALRARLETVIAAMTDGVIATDSADLVTSANVEALRILNFPPDDVIGRPLVDVLLLQRDGDPLRVSGRMDIEAELIRHDDVRVPVRVAAAPLGGVEGGQVVTLGDRSREAEVERMKTEFLANVSHELRTPLTPIKGYAEILTRRPNLGEVQVGQFAAEILNSTERMHRVVALLVDVASLDAGRVTPRRSELSVSALLDAPLETWRARWPDRANDLRRSIARGLPAVDADAEWVVKALTEYVDNAIKVTKAGSVVTVRAEAADRPDRVRIMVVDKGPGIEPDRIGELLGDFSQADASATRNLEGLGLGLGFVRRVSEQFDLDLYVRSTPGRGSEWGLDLPAAAVPTPTRRKRG